MKKYFISSDIHGQYLAIMKNLELNRFDMENPDHIFVSLGDHFDRGPQSDKVLELCLNLYEKGRFMGIRGNHDDMLIEYLSMPFMSEFNIISNGLGFTINQLAKTVYKYPSLLVDLSDEIIPKIKKNYPKLQEFLGSLVDKIEFGDYFLTHAGLTKSLDGSWYVNNWAKTPEFVKNFKNTDKTYIFGHWGAALLNDEFGYKPTKYNQIFFHENFIGIDSFSNISGEVNVLVLDELEDGTYDLILPITRLTPTCLSNIQAELEK